jgi:hypothetical protein
MKTKFILNILTALLSALFLGTAVSMALPVNPMWASLAIVLLYAAYLAGTFLLAKGSLYDRGRLLMALVAYDPCTVPLGTHTPAGDCLDQGSGILGLILVKKGFDLNTVVDSTTYAAAKTADNLEVIKDIEAYWPSASQQVIPGIAGRIERHGHYQWQLDFKHEGVDANLVFWNTVNNSRNYGIIFVTEEYKCFAPLDRDLEPVLCAIQAVPASDQEFGKTRFFQGTVKWKHKDIVQYLDLFAKSFIKPDFQP